MRERIIAIVAAIIFFVIGIFVGTKINKVALPQGAASDAQNTYQSGWIAAMKSLEASGAVPAIPEGISVKQLSGTIKSISGSTVTLSISTPGLAATPELATRTVTIDGNTKIEQWVQRDPADIQKDLEAFNAQLATLKNSPSTPGNIPTPPQTQNKQDANISDLKVGQSISVTSADDVKSAQQFTATEIDIQATIPTPATPAK